MPPARGLSLGLGLPLCLAGSPNQPRKALHGHRSAWSRTRKSVVQGQSEHSAIPVASLEHEVTPSTPSVQSLPWSHHRPSGSSVE